MTTCDRVPKADRFAAHRAGKIKGGHHLEMSQVDGGLATCDSKQKAARMKLL